MNSVNIAAKQQIKITTTNILNEVDACEREILRESNKRSMTPKGVGQNLL
jgi:hypothetical protein